MMREVNQFVLFP